MGKFNSRDKGVLKAKKLKARSAKKQHGAATQHKVQVSLQSGKRTGVASCVLLNRLRRCTGVFSWTA